MFQVEMVVSGSGEVRPYGPKVATLEECTKVVLEMDRKWDELYKATSEQPREEWVKAITDIGLDIYEGCDLYARHDDGRLFSLDGAFPDDKQKWEYMEPILINDGRSIVCTECMKFPCKHFSGACADVNR
jgi:hypothetical protein